MARTQQHAPESQPPARSGDLPRKLPGDSDVETPAPPASPAGGALFRALLAAGVDPAAAYTAVREMESMAGQSVVTQLGAQIQGLATTVGRIENGVETLKADVSTLKTDVSTLKTDVSTLKTDVSTLKTDVAVLKREVRLIWLLLLPTFVAILVRLFTN